MLDGNSLPSGVINDSLLAAFIAVKEQLDPDTLTRINAVDDKHAIDSAVTRCAKA